MEPFKKINKKIKDFSYKTFGVETSDKFRNYLNRKDKYIYDKKLAATVKGLAEESVNRDPSTKYDLELLIKLHQLFDKINLADNYKYENLLNSARSRYNYLISSDIDVADKVVTDFGAGHGENLIVASEFNIKKAVGLDYSADRFANYVDHLNPKSKKILEFKELDLVNEDLGHRSSDIVISFSAFEHFDDPGHVLDKCYRLLKKGGYLYAEFAAFNAPYAIHRKIYSGVPHIQNIFNDQIAYDFFYKHLKINDEINRYTKEKITDGNPYPEVNRWQIADYERLFLDKEKWEVINYSKIYNYKFNWMIRVFKDSFKGFSHDDLYADYLKFLIRKK